MVGEVVGVGHIELCYPTIVGESIGRALVSSHVRPPSVILSGGCRSRKISAKRFPPSPVSSRERRPTASVGR